MNADFNYSNMSDQELKRYMLEHRTDLSAFHAYMDRVYARPHQTVIEPDAPDWEALVLADIQEQIKKPNGDQILP